MEHGLRAHKNFHEHGMFRINRESLSVSESKPRCPCRSLMEEEDESEHVANLQKKEISDSGMRNGDVANSDATWSQVNQSRSGIMHNEKNLCRSDIRSG